MFSALILIMFKLETTTLRLGSLNCADQFWEVILIYGKHTFHKNLNSRTNSDFTYWDKPCVQKYSKGNLAKVYQVLDTSLGTASKLPQVCFSCKKYMPRAL